MKFPAGGTAWLAPCIEVILHLARMPFVPLRFSLQK